jgi:hypothetical protein
MEDGDYSVIMCDQDSTPHTVATVPSKKIADFICNLFDNLATDEESDLFEMPSGYKCKTCDNGLTEEEEEHEQCWDCAKIEQITEAIKEVLGQYILTDYQKDQVRKEVFK